MPSAWRGLKVERGERVVAKVGFGLAFLTWSCFIPTIPQYTSHLLGMERSSESMKNMLHHVGVAWQSQIYWPNEQELRYQIFRDSSCPQNGGCSESLSAVEAPGVAKRWQFSPSRELRSQAFLWVSSNAPLSPGELLTMFTWFSQCPGIRAIGDRLASLGRGRGGIGAEA